MLRERVINFAKKHHIFMVTLRFIWRGAQKIRYSIDIVANKTQPNLVLFESFMGRQYSDSPRAIYEYLVKSPEYKQLQFVWVAKDLDDFACPKNKRTQIVRYGTKEYRQAYAQARFWITNSRIPEYIFKKRRQVYIQTWHGTPLKKLGYDIQTKGGNAMNTISDIRHKYSIDSKKYDYLISPSDFCTQKFTSIFHLQKRKNIIKTLGSPRCDYIVNHSRQDVHKIKKQLKIPANKKVILYAPTWRDDQHQSGLGYTYKNQLDFAKLQKILGKEYVILFRTHYFIANQFDFSAQQGFVYNVSDYPDINDLYIISDMLITDYSSTMFDFAILRRPMLFFMYDLEKYKGELRDFYFDVKELPGPIIEDKEQLIKALEKFNPKQYWQKYQDSYQQFNDKFNHLADGEASIRTVQACFAKRYRSVPLLINLTKKIKLINDKTFQISGLCMTKFLRIQNPQVSKLRISINGKTYKPSFALSRGIPFIKKYRFNKYTFRVPIEDILNADIQNKIIVKYGAFHGRIIYSAWDFFKGKNRNSHVIITRGCSVYLRQTIKNTMYLTVREPNIFDGERAQIKLWLGWLISKIAIWQRPILIFEKECQRYEESGSVLYEKLIDMGYRNVYFIVNRDNHRIQTLPDEYRANLINKHSLKHIICFFRCQKFISTEAIAHAMQLRIANRLVINKQTKPGLSYIFLQHGVMYMVSLDSDLRTGFKKQQYKIQKTLVSSHLEAMHFVERGGFSLDDLYICGLPKFDRAVRDEDADKIIIMPTWRRWEMNQAAQDYTKTSYYKMIQRIISAIPATIKDKAIILPHPLMAKAIRRDRKFAEFFPDNVSYDNILRQCSLLITDYSSVAFDAFYRGANVIFDWHDKDECMQKYGEGTELMIEQSNVVFGDIIYKTSELKRAIKTNYQAPQSPSYVRKYRQVVNFHDGKNTERLIKKLKESEVI